MPSEKRSIVSLFAGCGGLDLGFVGGFKFAGHKCGRLPHEIIWANEIDKYACKAYRQNLGNHIVEGDVWDSLKDGLPQQDV